eukprot:scaffold34974_cov72-Cyclotella_meneghiniana.AAC.1
MIGGGLPFKLAAAAAGRDPAAHAFNQEGMPDHTVEAALGSTVGRSTEGESVTMAESSRTSDGGIGIF